METLGGGLDESSSSRTTQVDFTEYYNRNAEDTGCNMDYWDQRREEQIKICADSFPAPLLQNRKNGNKTEVERQRSGAQTAGLDRLGLSIDPLLLCNQLEKL